MTNGNKLKLDVSNHM